MACIDPWIQESGDWLVGGDLSVLGRVTWGDGLDQYRQAQYLAIMGVQKRDFEQKLTAQKTIFLPNIRANIEP